MCGFRELVFAITVQSNELTNSNPEDVKLSVWRTDKIPLGTKGRTSILSVESSASWVASFPVSRGKLPDRECFVTTFRQGGYTPCAAKAAIPCGLAASKFED